MNTRLPVIVLLGASVFWGLSWLPLKTINGMGIDGIVLTLGAYGILALALTPLLLKQAVIWRGHKKAVALIFLLGGSANLAFTYALINGEVIRVMVLFYLLPVWGVLGGKFFLKEEIDRWRWLGVGLAISGAFLILGGFDALGGAPTWIDLIALLSGLFFALNNLVFRAAQAVPVGRLFHPRRPAARRKRRAPAGICLCRRMARSGALCDLLAACSQHRLAVGRNPYGGRTLLDHHHHGADHRGDLRDPYCGRDDESRRDDRRWTDPDRGIY